MIESKWIIVSSKLPFKYNKSKNEIQSCTEDIESALMSLKNNKKMLWFGSISSDVPEKLLKEYITKNNENFHFHPIFIPKELYDIYDNDFCNKVLWPLLHYELQHVKYSDEAFEAFEEVNKIFALEILKIIDIRDNIWINDFKLSLLPKHLKSVAPSLKIGYFLPTPFPSSEVFRQLPKREEILEGILGSDLVGFQELSYLKHFSSAVQNILGHQTNELYIETHKRNIHLGVFPLSVDVSEIENTVRSLPELKKNKKKIILSVDKFDYSKGLILKLKSFQRLLKENPKLISELEMIVIALPCHQDLEEYINYKKEVEFLISDINGENSTVGHTPIRYLNKAMKKEDLLFLYRKSDILLISSKREGSNIRALEFICAQDASNPGSIVISEFTGGMSVLSRATFINPWDVNETVKSLESVLEKSLLHRQNDYKEMFSNLKNYNVMTWAISFMNKLIVLNKEVHPLEENITVQLKQYEGLRAFVHPALLESSKKPLHVK